MDNAKGQVGALAAKMAPTEVSATAECVVDRRDFGISYPGKANDLIQDNVVITVQLVAPRG